MPVKDQLSSQERKSVLEDLKSRFSWPVEEVFMREEFSVRTDFTARSHRVTWPRQALGKDPEISTRVDPSILGGIKVKVGSRLFDASLRSKLDSLKFALKRA